ncbi:hypothetical protein FOCC_FOCC007752, partial [Frankliniella occidentalis]
MVEVDPCDTTWGPLLYGGHRCDPNTTLCVPFHLGHGLGGLGLRRMSYRCQCRYGYGPVNPPGGSPPLNDTYTEPPHFTYCPPPSPRTALPNPPAPDRSSPNVIGPIVVVALFRINFRRLPPRPTSGS